MLIVLLLVLSNSLANACFRSPFVYGAERIKQLAQHADQIIWAEALDIQIIYPEQDLDEINQSEITESLEELLALVKKANQQRYQRSHRPNISTMFNELHLIKGSAIPFATQCANCASSISYIYHNMKIGEKYILFYKKGQLIAAAKANDTKRYQAILQVVLSPVQLFNDHN